MKRLTIAKSSNYQKELKVVKDLGPPPKNLKAEKQRLGLEKKSDKVKRDASQKSLDPNKS